MYINTVSTMLYIQSVPDEAVIPSVWSARSAAGWWAGSGTVGNSTTSPDPTGNTTNQERRKAKNSKIYPILGIAGDPGYLPLKNLKFCLISFKIYFVYFVQLLSQARSIL